MRVFLTGATGLLGSHVAEELRRREHGVVALYRSGADTRFLEELGCELAEGDVRDDADSLAVVMEGCTHIVHAAALVYAGGEWPKVRQVNVDGTRNVLTGAVRAGLRHAVHVSSVAVYGDAEGPVDENTPTDVDLSPSDLYARSKREAEEVARGIEEKRGLPVTIVRPAALYGERDRLLVPSLTGILRLPLVPLFGPATNALPVVYSGNVATAIVLALEAERAAATFDVGLDHPLTQRELFEGLARGMGLDPRFVSVPAGLIGGGGEMLARLGVPTPGAKHLAINRVTRLALDENPFPSTHIRAELGWKPSYEHGDALERTGRWARNHA